MRRLIFALAFLCQIAGAHASGFLGSYIWGGTLQANSGGLNQFYDSVNQSLVGGIDTIRLKIGINQAGDYNISPDPCATSFTMACYAGLMFASSAWDNPGLKRVIITTIDFACNAYAPTSSNGCLYSTYLTANQGAIEAEYTGLYQVLLARFGTRNIEFIIDNWEGDNFAYCGNSYAFATNSGSAASCVATWPSGQTNPQRVAAVLQWVALKQTAATAFLASNPSFQLKVAVEFNTYSVFAANCPISGTCNAATDTVFDQIKLAGNEPYCSWSSYDTQGPPGGAYLAAVQAILPYCTKFFIGEGSYDQDFYTPQMDIDVYAAMYQINQQPGVIGVIPWQGFDFIGATSKYGFWSGYGTQQNINLLGPLRPTMQTIPFHK